jgi:hypothetical protein
MNQWKVKKQDSGKSKKASGENKMGVKLVNVQDHGRWDM